MSPLKEQQLTFEQTYTNIKPLIYIRNANKTNDNLSFTQLK